MTVYGWDASDYDWDPRRGPMDLAAARASGISFFTFKVTEGKYGWFHTVNSAETFKRAAAAKFPVLGGYHVLHPTDMGGTVAEQVDWYFDRLTAVFPGWKTHPCFIHQIDAEKFDYMTRRPNQAEITEFADRAVTRAGCAPTQLLVYAPQWLYGDNLAGLPYMLWQSAYGSNPITGFKNAYPGDDSPGWQPYSGITPTVLQYGSRTTIGSQHTCDANAIRVGNEAALVDLFIGDAMPTADEIAKAVATYPIGPDAATVAQTLRRTKADLDTANTKLATLQTQVQSLQAQVAQLLAQPAPTPLPGTVSIHIEGDLPGTVTTT